MADRPLVKTQRLTRDKLAQFLPTHELIKAFENLSQDVAETIPDAIEGSGSDADSVLTNTLFGRQIQPAAPMPAESSSIFAAVLFARPPQQSRPVDDGASQILATQIFGA